MVSHYFQAFTELIRTPFLHTDLIWGVVPLYFGWLMNEVTSSKASYQTAIQTGFAFLWAGAHWIYQMTTAGPTKGRLPGWEQFQAVNGMVTLLVLVIGFTALTSGLRRRYPRYGAFLGHARFASYFMIAIFPIQSGHLQWSWHYVQAIGIMAVPVWILVHFTFLAVRRK